MSNQLPDPHLTRVYRLEATLGQPLDLGDIAQGHRRIVPLSGGKFTGPELNGELLPGSSADWQIVLPDGTALGILHVPETVANLTWGGPRNNRLFITATTSVYAVYTAVRGACRPAPSRHEPRAGAAR